MRRIFFLLGGLITGVVCARGDIPVLLNAAVGNWAAGKEDWAFTQRSRTLAEDGAVKEERLERYDPSLPDNQRWRLLEVNGRPPNDEQREAIEVRRNRKPRKHANKSPSDLLDLPTARAVSGNPQTVTYEVALRADAARLVQTDKLALLITVGRETRGIERVSAVLREPMRVALGLARITDLDFDLNFDGDGTGKPEPPKDEPSGTARVEMRKLGERMEYEWSEFKRVNVYRAE